MGSQQGGDADQRRLKLLKYLNSNSFAIKQSNFESFKTYYHKLSSEDAVSPKVFKMIFDLHLGPVIGDRTYIMKELSDIWKVYPTLGSEPGAEQRRDQLTRMSEAAVSAKEKLEGLLKEIVAAVASCVRRVDWKKHGSNKSRGELRAWLMEKQMLLLSLLGDSNNSSIKAGILSALFCLTKGTAALSSPQSTSKAKTVGDSPTTKINTNRWGPGVPNFDFSQIKLPDINIPRVKDTRSDVHRPKINYYSLVKTGMVPTSTNTSKKRPLDEFDASDDDTAPPPTKKQKQGDIPVGVWWGPNNSKLSCADSFFDVIREFRAYIANPPHAPGTHKHSVQMKRFLKRALAEVNMSHRYNVLLLKHEWNFRDKELRLVRGPATIRPGAEEAVIRVGVEGFRGMNEFKRILGGGLTEYEKDDRDHAPGAQGMLALAHSYSISGRVGLRGGDGSHSEGDDEALPAENGRDGSSFRSRDPAVLWEQLLQDASYPEGLFQEFVKEERPPMVDPQRIGNPLKVHRSVMEKIPDHAEWQKIQGETDPTVINGMLRNYETSIDDAQTNIHQFLHESKHIVQDQPKLNEEGGKKKPKQRYKGNIRDRDFAKPIGDAFRARMYQIFRLALVQKLDAQGQSNPRQVLEEERDVLVTWDQHEELYMEWENLRWFGLSKPFEIADLEDRYQSREVLRTIWEIERDNIDNALGDLENNPGDHANSAKDSPGINYTIPRRRTASASPSPILPVPHPTPFGGLESPAVPRVVPRATLHQTPPTINPFVDAPNAFANPTPLEEILQGAPHSDDLNALQFWADLDMPALIKASSKPTRSRLQNPYTVSNKATNGSDKPKGRNIIVDARNETSTHIGLRFLEKTVAMYEKKLNETIRANAELDNMNPGNAAIIERNNIDIMAKQQLIWSVNTEILNLRRSQDSFAEDSYGKGAERNPDVPDNSYYWRYTTPLPKKPMPLGVQDLGLGLMQSDHPAPEIPRELLRRSEDFVENAEIPEDRVDPTGGDQFGIDGYNHSEIPKDWPGFIALHKASWSRNQRSGTAQLSWDEWIEAVYQALRNSTRGLRHMFADRSPYKSEDALRHRVRDVHERVTESRRSPPSSGWRTREKQRSAILETLAAEVNAVLAANRLPEFFARVESLPPVPTGPEDVDTDADTVIVARGEAAMDREAAMDKALAYLSNMNDARLSMKKLNRLRSSGRWNVNMAADLENADQTRAHYKAAFERVRNGADEATMADLDQLEEQMEVEFREDVMLAEEAIDRQVAQEEADRNATEAQPAPLKKPLTELEKAERIWEELNAKSQESRQKARKARSDLAAAKEAAASASPQGVSRLHRTIAYLQAQETHLLASSDEAWIQARIASEAVSAQRQFSSSTPESNQELLERYDVLTQDSFGSWASLYRWDELAPTPKHTHDQWVIDVTWLMHEAYKAIGLNVGAEYWGAMYENFWATQGASFARKRTIWMYVLMHELNKQIDQATIYDEDGKGVRVERFVETPEQPPAEWLYDTPTKEELIAQEEREWEAIEAEAEDGDADADGEGEPGAIAALAHAPGPGYHSSPEIPLRQRRRAKRPRFLPPPRVPGARPTTPPMPIFGGSPPRRMPQMMSPKDMKPAVKPALKPEKTKKKKQPTAWPGAITPMQPGLAQPIFDLLQPDGGALATAAEEEEEEEGNADPLAGLFSPIDGSYSDIEDLYAPSAEEPPLGEDAPMTDLDGGGSDRVYDNARDSIPAPALPPTTTKAPAEPVEQNGATSMKNDAWPDLRDLIMATWNARIAREVLRQKEGDMTGVPPGRGEGWPRPVRVRKDGMEYMCL
ncbi:hypothetical protein F5Y07DRAFT_398385 [Xylaria sp. FL0933]|nr:hypothetical protein F5Y07DRAFT_398385 [Xylaria sp. FL0933]